jgi:cobalamin biosynthesis Mg chelatase CobN
MHSTIIILPILAAVIPAALAEELRAGDVPVACTTICKPIVDLTNTCDIDPNEINTDDDKKRKLRLRDTEEPDEAIEANCICTNKSFDVARVMGLCASCIAQNGDPINGKKPPTPPHPPSLRLSKSRIDAGRIMSQCSFTSTSYSPAATTAVAGVQVQATKPATSTATSTSTGGMSSSTNTVSNGAGRLAVSVVAAAAVACVALLIL